MPILCRVFWPSGLDGYHGPFRLGRFSWAINVASLIFIVVMSVFFILPTVSSSLSLFRVPLTIPQAHPVTAVNMNYAVVAIGGLILLVSVQYVLKGRHVYQGIVHTYTDSGVVEPTVGNGKDTF